MSGFVGTVVARNDAGRFRPLGTCFSLFSSVYFVTCDHVVAAAEKHGVHPHILGEGLWPVPVRAAVRLPACDLAVLHAPHDQPIEPFRELARPVVGQAVQVNAFIEGAWRQIRTTVAEMGLGRVPETDDRPHQEYEALVLAKWAPSGWSGAPVLGEEVGQVLGMVTCRLGQSEQGIALDVLSVEAWLRETIEQEGL